MIRLEKKICNIILTEKQQKDQPYHPEKMINMTFLQAKKYCHLHQSRIIEQANFTYSPLEKPFEIQKKTIEQQGKEELEALEFLRPEESKKCIKSVEGLFPKDMRTNEIKKRNK